MFVVEVEGQTVKLRPRLRTAVNLLEIHHWTTVCLQVYELTFVEAEDEDSFDEDTEITEAVSPRTHTYTHTHVA